MSPDTSPAAGASAAVFDVDGTLCASRSTTALIWHRRAQDTWLRHALWRASLLWKAPAAYLADTIDRNLADRMVYREFAGLSHGRLLDDSHQCCKEVLLPACFPDALAEMEEHRAAGHRIILLSGGIDAVLQPLADALGAELLAQRLVFEGDRLTGTHLGYETLGEDGGKTLSQGARKAAALRRHADMTKIDLARSYAYGDSINDAQMLDAVGTGVAVNPDGALRRLARDKGWQIRRWRMTSSADGAVEHGAGP